MTNTPTNTPKAPTQGAASDAAPKPHNRPTPLQTAQERISKAVLPPKAAAPAADAGDNPAAPKKAQQAPKNDAAPPAAKKTPQKDGADKPVKGAADDGSQPDDEELEGQTDPDGDDTPTDDTDDTDGAEGDDADGQTDDDDGDSDVDGDAQGDLHTVFVDGEEVQVSYEELVAGYSREADYRKKTADLARERREVLAEKEAVKDLPEKRKQYEEGAVKFNEKAVFVLKALESRFMPQPPPAELAKTDPAAYLHQKELYNEAIQFSKSVYGEIQGIEAIRKQEHSEAVNKGRQKLYEAMPELSDTATRGRLTDYIRQLGYTDEQMKQEADHRLFMLAEKARRWDALQAKKKEIHAKVPTPKVTKATVAPVSKKAQEQRQRQQQRHVHKTKGTVDSAAAAISTAGILKR